MPALGARDGHTIVIARDWRRGTWCYLTDPEGNLIELQSWSPADPDG